MTEATAGTPAWAPNKLLCFQFQYLLYGFIYFCFALYAFSIKEDKRANRQGNWKTSLKSLIRTISKNL